MVNGNGKPRNDKIEAAIDKTEAAKPAGPIIVAMPCLPAAQSWPETADVTLKPKPSEQPSLLIWIAELGAYQPVFLPPGSVWQIHRSHKEGDRLWLPGQGS